MAPNNIPSFSWCQHTLRYQGTLYVGSSGKLYFSIWQDLYSTGTRGHSRLKSTLKSISSLFYYPSLTVDVKKRNGERDVHQCSKVEHIPSPGLLKPLPKAMSGY